MTDTIEGNRTMTNEADGLAAVEIARRMLTHLDECDRIGKFASIGTDHIRQICEALTSTPAAEPVGVREAEGKLVATARRNIRTFISSATFKSENDRQAALACVEVLEEHINGLGDLVTVLRSAFAAASSLATHPPAVAERTKPMSAPVNIVLLCLTIWLAIGGVIWACVDFWG